MATSFTDPTLGLPTCLLAATTSGVAKLHLNASPFIRTTAYGMNLNSLVERNSFAFNHCILYFCSGFWIRIQFPVVAQHNVD